MKTMLALVLLSVSFAAPSYADKKPAVNQENMEKLRAVKTIFVDGNGESSDKIREHLESQTCFTLANNKSKADAIMTISEQQVPSNDFQVHATSVTITNADGDQLWTKSKQGVGAFRSGAGMAADDLLHDLKKQACTQPKK
jgi:hypothetical protein